MRLVFPIALMGLLLAARVSSALSTQDINNTIAACSANHCATWCGDIVPGAFVCYCVDCKSQTGTALSQVGGIPDASTATVDTIYQMDDEQYVCKDKAEEGRLQCVPLKYQVKVLDAQSLPTEGKDRDAADEILRMKSVIAAPKTEVAAPMEVVRPVKQPTKSTVPLFLRTTPVR
ncbi:MAG TPA: hypothetical protein VFX30_11495 [bacterium]|nr:hypothetical protein [bacterium]